MREAWTDSRLDRLEQRMEFRFEQVEQQMDSRFEQVDQRFEQVNERFEQVNERLDEMGERFGRLEGRIDAYARAMMQASGVIIAALIGFIATLAAVVIAT